ncbi:MAG TPA: hypothetical protein VF129_06030 [Actinomycetota bacterium]
MSARAETLRAPGFGRPKAWLGFVAAMVAVVVTFAILVRFDGSGDSASTGGSAGGSAVELTSVEKLVRQGLVPPETLQPYRAPAESISSAQDRALMAAVAEGLVPEEALDDEHVRIRELVNRGLVPREALQP